MNQRDLRLIESREGLWNSSHGERFQTPSRPPASLSPLTSLSSWFGAKREESSQKIGHIHGGAGPMPYQDQCRTG
jgi:hypothetical protein